ncbi:MKI67 FHA domain-interacting nucleolar phosphoprotein [Toxorhynchites rutilus septentrionalis]|uniref:MKI67 FHA domain-interacting nucleolar phosphoprotein n=1 Tax=Toxorhynchites rutilus septentrionalis TaxID=329112 RepID=UPI002479C85F|nr:MKI67 FHA domain-interacting nucleolar phosphoprotein [Toxorhynchites rutilus septentrionalis]
MPAVAKSSKVKLKGKKNEKQPLILSKPNKKRPPVKEQSEKGIIYIKHLPHGFFEKQLRLFFSQFGDVTRVHVARSKKTLRSRGYAYVEFRYREVAQIAAETMDNYLMFGKILRTGMLPAGAKHIPRKYEMAYDANGNETSTYKIWVKRLVAKSNGRVTKTGVVNRNNRALAKLKQLKAKYAEMGVDYSVDDITPTYAEADIKKPEHDSEEEKLRAVKAKKASRQKKKMEKQQTSVQSMGTNPPIEDSSDDDEGSSFQPLESTDWDMPQSDGEDGKGEPGEGKVSVKGQSSKSAAVKFAAKAKLKIDKEKSKLKNKPSEQTNKVVDSQEKGGKRKKDKASKPVETVIPDTTESARKEKVGPKKDRKVAGGGIVKKSKAKKQKVIEKASSPLKAAAKVLVEDPSVRKVKAKNMKKKRKA